MASITHVMISKLKQALSGTSVYAIATLMIGAASTLSAIVHANDPSTGSLMCDRVKSLSTEPIPLVVGRMLPNSTREQRCRQYFWHVLKIKPLNEIFDDTEVRRYKAAIAVQDCQAASNLLRKRFAATHPAGAFILTEEEEAKHWRFIVVSTYFEELFLCFKLAEIDQAQRELDRAGLDIAPYRGNPFSQDDIDNIGKRSGRFDPRVEARDRPVAILMEVHLFVKSTTYWLALLRLSDAGVALEFHPLWELFLAFRLRDAGITDPLIASILSRPLDLKIRTEIEQHAKNDLTGWFQVPVHPGGTYPKKTAPN